MTTEPQGTPPTPPPAAIEPQPNLALQRNVAIIAVVLLGAILALVLWQNANQGTSAASPTPSFSASATIAPSAVPSPVTTPPAETPAPTPEVAAFMCGLTLQSEQTGDSVHLTDVQVTTEEGFDRVTFVYAEDSIPGLAVRSAQPPFTEDPSGNPIEVAGAPVYQVTIIGGTMMAADGSSTYTGSMNFEPGFEQIVQLVEAGDFEAVNTWYLGVNGSRCLRAFPLADPTRIVIDVQH